jgi:hypothetical protein
MMTLALLLARTCVAEIGFQEDVQECKIMWAINDANARTRNRSLTRQTKKFNSYWRSREQRARRPWIKHLTNEERPRHWQKNLQWAMYRTRWLRYLEAAKEYVQNRKQTRHPCPQAIDYGAPGEIPKGRLVKVKCMDGAKQWFWGWKR